MRARILDINPEADVTAMPLFTMLPQRSKLIFQVMTSVVDAIDTVSSKLLLIERAAVERIPIISSMGAGNKLDPTALEVADIYQTSVCPACTRYTSGTEKTGDFGAPGGVLSGRSENSAKSGC